MSRPPHLKFITFAAFVLIFPPFAHAEDAAAAGNEFFEKQVRPLLANTCYECHAEKKHKAALRLNSRAKILEGGDDGPAVVPGKPAESLLIKSINYEGDFKMPPKEKLKDADIAILTKWVAMGLPWPEEKDAPAVAAAEPKKVYQITDEQRQFWSFQPVKPVRPPTVKDDKWARNDIDRFILAALEEKNLKPAPQADKHTLIRRATFDLTGLPPTPEEIDAFLADNSPDAFAKVVERLLASPHYGERWGRHWLDVVRYADSRDSRGIGRDGDIADAWRYRDWVVNALNHDLPYDQFVVNQIAGDLLPPAKPGEMNVDGTVATGLLAIGEWGTGDADKEKMMTDIVDDQIDVVSRSIMGLTMACARCHDHKFDPIPTADYYSMAGIFFSSHIIPSPGKKTDGSPMLRVPLISAAEVAKIEAQKKRAQELEKQIKARQDSEYAAAAKQFLADTTKYLEAAWDFKHLGGGTALNDFAKARSLQEFALQGWLNLSNIRCNYPLMTKRIRDVADVPGVAIWRGEPDCPNFIFNTNTNEVHISTFVLPARSVAMHPGPEEGVCASWKAPMSGKFRIAGRVIDADSHCGDGIAWVIEHQRGASAGELASGEFPNGGAQGFEQGNNAQALNEIEVTAGDRINLLVLPKGEYTCDTTIVDLTIASKDGNGEWNLARDILDDPLAANPHADHAGRPAVWQFCDMAGSGRGRNNTLFNPVFGKWLRAMNSDGAKDELLPVLKEIQTTVNAATPKDALYKDMTGSRSPFFVNSRDDGKYLKPEVAAELAQMRNELDALKKTPPPQIPTALAAQEGGVPQSAYEGFHDAHIMIRGSYTRLSEIVPRRFPRIIAGENQQPIANGSGRLELAKWLASPSHPLTARVMVNRIWLYHFGAGIVRTPSNFGKLGERPTHPELLDFLANRFIENGWSLKAMHREIMLSAAYQQSSESLPETQKADPDNRLFGHMNRRRLEAEALRDSLLLSSGRLDFKMGGLADRDAATKRRMLYLMTIRSDRSSFGPLFDAADSTAQVPVRTVSTVAPQALYMLNDKFVLEQTSELAKRLVAAAPDDASRISRGYVLLYGRAPEAKETEIGLQLLTRARESGANDEQAWTQYAQILLCANEFVFVD